MWRHAALRAGGFAHNVDATKPAPPLKAGPPPVGRGRLCNAKTLANALHLSGEAELIAVLHNTGFKLGAGGVSAINTFYGNAAVEVGAFMVRS